VSFVHLHVHSQFSLLDGTASPAAIARRAADLGMPAVALTDTSNLYGGVAFYKACKDAKVRPILGCELTIQPEGIGFRDPERDRGGYQAILLVEDARGYGNLCALITRAIFDGLYYRPRIDLDLLGQHRDGLIVLTGGPKGLVGRALGRERPEAAAAWLSDLSERLGPDRLYVELQDLGLPRGHELLAHSRAIAAEVGVPTVVTNAVHYLEPEQAAVHEVLHAIAHGISLDDPARPIAPTDQAWFKPAEDMRALFGGDPAIDRTLEIAERCSYHYDFKTYHFPATTPPDTATPDARGELAAQPDTDANWAYFYAAFPPPRDFGLPDPKVQIPPRPPGAGNLQGYFAWYCREGLALRLQLLPPEAHAEYHQRLETEITIIGEMGFPAYMLIVAEFINWSKDNGIPVGPGRGSAAGSLVAWAMRITDIDPIRFSLLFERFLNPRRVSMPDIDVDFCQDRREEAIEHVREKYGAPLVSQIITYGTLKAKAAVRDVCRVLDLSFNDADRIAKLIPDDLTTTLESALRDVETLRALNEGDPKVRRVLDIAREIEGLCRQTGIHAAGVVIADRPLVEYAPLYRDGPDGGPVVQYDMKSAESIGLIKFDFLGLKTLDQIRDATALILRNHGIAVDVGQIDLDDAATYALLERGDALGVFQLESSGMRELLTKLKPNCVDDMVALVALYRPGPLQSGMTDEFVERKHARRDVSYALPMLEPILRGTYGTVIYQEQVMQIAQVMAGYDLGEADMLRRAMGKKNAAEMDQQRSRFVEGSVERGISRTIATEVFDQLAMFAAYGFNKSHSAAYGMISYQTAWLKAHYRPEYMAAVMTVEQANTDKVLTYVRDCQAHGVRVEPVCLNRSSAVFEVPPPADRGPDGDAIYFGLGAIKNVGHNAVQAILDARAAVGGRFENPSSFFEHIDYKRVNKRVIEQLVKAGAFDFSGLPRRAIFESIEAASAAGQRKQADRAAGQGSLFGALTSVRPEPPFRFPDVPDWPLTERLQHERDVLGLYLSGHPMQVHAGDVARFASCPIAAIDSDRLGDEVRVVGTVAELRTVKTRAGDRMAFVQLEDVDATVECTFFAGNWSRSQRTVEAGAPILVTGTVEQRDAELKIRATSAELLSEVRARTKREVTFRLRAEDLAGVGLDRFTELLRAHPGTSAARVVVEVPGRYTATLGLPETRVDAAAPFEEHLYSLIGRSDAVTLS
jgi:DNA polymerase III subunit alpha